YLASGLVVGTLIGACNLPSYSRFEAHGANVQGVVTGTTCGNHATFAYAFRVGDKTYTGSGAAGYGNPSCASLKTGDIVVVRYLVADPAQSLPGDINARLSNEWHSVVTGALVLPAAALFILRRRWKRRAESRA
ncbi:MAG TPA: DUF3592 domain-containing protein, partial [Methylomirabilota bacterium]|nr:DUF3592 domain-containing protein [Methylomirabilota bacterium]